MNEQFLQVGFHLNEKFLLQEKILNVSIYKKVKIMSLTNKVKGQFLYIKLVHFNLANMFVRIKVMFLILVLCQGTYFLNISRSIIALFTCLNDLGPQ